MDNEYQDDAKWSIVCVKGDRQFWAEFDPSEKGAIEQVMADMQLAVDGESV